MKTYGLKFIDFLSNTNVVLLKSSEDLRELRTACEKVGLDLGLKLKWQDLMANLVRNDRIHQITYKNKPVVYAEYRNDKGFGIYRQTEDELINWYGIAPISVEEILAEIN